MHGVREVDEMLQAGKRRTCPWLKAEATGVKAPRVVSSVIFDQR